MLSRVLLVCKYLRMRILFLQKILILGVKTLFVGAKWSQIFAGWVGYFLFRRAGGCRRRALQIYVIPHLENPATSSGSDFPYTKNCARPRSHFIYTKNSARPRSHFIYTKNSARQGSDLIYTNLWLRKRVT